ncbi:MAG: hypothetical protein K0S65_4062, partial [Labilithrix sp.]|nr:hypothetical protein [Labilithrix sp.]
TLDEPRVIETVTRLARLAEENDPAILADVRAEVQRRGDMPFDDEDPHIAAMLRDAYIPVSLDAGKLLYLLARAQGSRTIVEFGTSFGISTIHLAAAARENGGRVITTEKEPEKVKQARANLERAGLADVVEVREGDARMTLRDLDTPIDLLFLDGWKALYLPVLRLVEPRLRSGALVVDDDLEIARAMMQPFLEHVRRKGNGYVSIELPLGDAMEISVRC